MALFWLFYEGMLGRKPKTSKIGDIEFRFPAMKLRSIKFLIQYVSEI